MDELFFTGQRGRVTQDQYGEVKITFIVPMSDADKAMNVPIEVPPKIAILRENNG